MASATTPRKPTDAALSKVLGSAELTASGVNTLVAGAVHGNQLAVKRVYILMGGSAGKANQAFARMVEADALGEWARLVHAEEWHRCHPGRSFALQGVDPQQAPGTASPRIVKSHTFVPKQAAPGTWRTRS